MPRLQVSTLPADMNGKKTVRAWMTKLHLLPASHELNDADVRQLLFDLESAYNEVGGFVAGRVLCMWAGRILAGRCRLPAYWH